MGTNGQSRVPDIVEQHEQALLTEWVRAQLAGSGKRGVISERELREQAREFLSLFVEATRDGDVSDIRTPAWGKVRELLGSISEARGRQGFTPSETASFIFSLKEPLFARLREAFAGNPQALADETWTITRLLDDLGLFTTEVHQKSRDEVITRQQRDMLELSTPVVQLAPGILALPIIGTLDSERSQTIMENLLQKIVSSGSAIAIIDITGVPTVDTLVAQHLLKTVAAARLMGADCIISGIRPQIAQTIVHLGVNLGDVVSKATLADAFQLALQRTGYAITRVPGRA